MENDLGNTHWNSKRRDFLRVGGLSFLGMTTAQYLRAAEAARVAGSPRTHKGQACILVWLSGGPPQMDTWDPKPNSNFKAISTNTAGIQISELFPRVAKLMDRLSIIRSMHTEENNHPEGTYYGMTGHRPNPTMRFPSFGSIISKELGSRNDIPPYVVTPPQSYPHSYAAGFIGPRFDPLVVPDPSLEDFKVPDLTLPKSLSPELIENRRALLKIVDRKVREKEEFAEFDSMDTYQQQALRMILAPNVRTAFDLTQESAKNREAYGRTRFGQSMLLARRLVEAGCRFVTAEGYEHSEWDTHFKNDDILRKTLAPKLDQALSVLVEDLHQRGLFESTVVVVMGEFGRTPDINPEGGRDHWAKCWSLLIGGGGIRGGKIVGSSDERAANVAQRMVTQGDLFATIYKALGIDWSKTYLGPGGRPIYIANSIGDKAGKAVEELV
ncbi:MAG: DUF1501 domain-containing protein [Bryobacteraceae bacterium]